MSRTLNNGTLGLRFMQNAQQPKNSSQVIPPQSSPPDDAEWHIPQNLRDMWTSAATDSNSVTTVSEPSYLPFVFHAEDKASPSFKGRRSFVHGKEVIPQPEPVQSSDPPQPNVTKIVSDSVSGASGASRNPRDSAFLKPKKDKTKPVSISGFKSSVSATSSPSILPGKKPVLPASSLIYQDADVGVDFGSTRRAASRAAGFIKPAGVDAPPLPPQPQQKPNDLPVVDAKSQVNPKKRTINTSDSFAHSTCVPEDSSRKKRKK